MHRLSLNQILIILSTTLTFQATSTSSETILDGKSWLQAAQSCRLLGSNNLGEVNIVKISISSNIADNCYWIGAISQSIWFEFQAQINCGITSSTIDTCPGNSCYSECTGQDSADGRLCYCEFESPRRFARFMRWPTPPSSINGSIRGDCVAFTKTQRAGYHEVLPCTNLLPPICQGFGESNPIPDSKSWLEAIKSCSTRPISSFDDLSRYNISIGSQGWTGITRISARKWSGGEDSTPLRCIAVNVRNMSLEEFPCDTELRSLCENGTISNIKGDTGYNGTPLAVGLTSGFVFLVILIVVGVIFLKRGKRNKLHTTASFHNKNYDTAPDTSIPPEYAEVMYDATSPDIQANDDTYDHARIQSLGRVLAVRTDVFGPKSEQGQNDDYDHLH